MVQPERLGQIQGSSADPESLGKGRQQAMVLRLDLAIGAGHPQGGFQDQAAAVVVAQSCPMSSL